MADDVFVQQLGLILLQQEEEEFYKLAQAGILFTVLYGIEESRLEKIRRRNPTRLYLTRAQLLPNPRIATPWQQLWSSQSDRAFITTMGVDVTTFRYLLEGPGRFADEWENTPIPRNDVSAAGNPRLGARSLDAAGALGLVMHYLGSAMLETSLQQIFALIPTTVTRYLKFARRILLTVLQRVPEAEIRMPQSVEELEELTDLICVRHSLLYGAFASIDGLSLGLEESSDAEMENATYNGWKSAHCINNILVFSPKGTIVSAVLNSPGSWHDSHVAKGIFEQLRTGVPDPYYLIADTAFPRGTASIAGKIQAPLKSGQTITGDPDEQQEILKFNRQLVSYRQSAEWGMHAMQGSFGRLRVPLPVEDSEERVELLEMCCRMNNIRANLVGISQIRSVYMPIWRQSEDDRLWTDLGNMIFGDIRRRDRVSRFHLVIDQAS